MQLIDLRGVDHSLLEQAARLLVDGFREHWPNAWPNLQAALDEVQEALEPGKIARAALDEQGVLLGWIGGMPEYDGNAWELHPLVVRADQRRRGLGRALVEDFEQQVARRGGMTIYLGTDDEDGMTSLADTDLYLDLPGAIAGIRNLKGHPYEFYQKLDFTICGVIPDANGPGKPDILMAKRVQPRSVSGGRPAQPG
jgi:aminoglycoside 6'-N-acetyltransferase I